MPHEAVPSRTYLDYNATAPMRDPVRAAVCEVLQQPGNASSVHAEGRRARHIIEEARISIAETLNCFPGEIVFTGSATEANNMALRGLPCRRVLVSAVEHPSVLGAAEAVEHIPVDRQGVVRLEALEALLKRSEDPALVSVMLANNETGVIQPVRQIVALAHACGAMVHTDAVQALGRIPVSFSDLGVDMMTLSSHKCGGPVGAGVLVVKDNTGEEPLHPLLRGGTQENRRRAGTENIAAIAGMARAVELAAYDMPRMRQVETWLHRMEQECQALGAVVFGAGAERLPNTTCLTMPGVNSSTQLMHFDLAGIAISAGAACTSGKVGQSHVLAAMGVEAGTAQRAIRVSAGWHTSEADIQRFTKEWKTLRDRVGKKAKEELAA